MSLKKIVLVAVLTFTAALPAGAAELGLTGATPRFQGGLRVTGVQTGSLAADLGLEPGDVIVTINGTLVNTLQEGRAGLAAAAGKLTLVVINVRNGQFLQLEAGLPPAPGPVVLLAPAPGSGPSGAKAPLTAKPAKAGKATILKAKP